MDAAGVGVVGKKNFGAGNTGFFIAGRACVQSVNTKFSAGGYRLRERSTQPCVGVGYDFDHHNGLSLNYDYDRGRPVQCRREGTGADVGLRGPVLTRVAPRSPTHS
ncbi:hypothetical protein OVA13_13645 [Pseudoxanthomonas sp. SL93]|uniref:hypothetical protein n=1 Tax=Pseudoxanthomonas sp. SL93 TaxID=2995142 RepID=UPI00226D734A|nr:hypothetical protein [Pseudoxanthomonas sp. SL93]WAC62426.1 hypothetical protein OVA13_13645 [Pseudoxanthomonas sp. SL93]